MRIALNLLSPEHDDKLKFRFVHLLNLLGNILKSWAVIRGLLKSI